MQGGTGHAKPKVPEPALRVVPVAGGRAADPWVVLPRAATNHPEWIARGDPSLRHSPLLDQL